LITYFTAKAKYITLNFIIKKLLYIRKLFNKLSLTPHKPTIIYKDNLLIIKFLKQNKVNHCNKHINIK
ncbi:hypothetical protein EV356DRAFT_457997, partial [Viridothelium virens]